MGSNLDSSPTFSVIIPTLNEEETIADCLSHLRQVGSHIEMVVADGGSTDRTESQGFPI